jgi:hypothetical protein
MANRKEVTSNARIRFNIGGGREEAQKGSGSTHQAVNSAKSNVDQKLPTDHFESDGLSAGKQTGPIRGADAYQGPRESGEKN